MSKRGSGSGSTRVDGSKDGAIAGGAKRTIEARYIEGRGWQRGRYDTEVLEATTDGKGNLTFEYAQPDTKEKTAKTNKTNYLTYNVQAGAVHGKSFGINWDKGSLSAARLTVCEQKRKNTAFLGTALQNRGSVRNSYEILMGYDQVQAISIRKEALP